MRLVISNPADTSESSCEQVSQPFEICREAVIQLLLEGHAPSESRIEALLDYIEASRAGPDLSAHRGRAKA